MKRPSGKWSVGVTSHQTNNTDPQNLDYVVESCATRNFESWRAGDEEEEKQRQKRKSEEMGDAMKSLENRMLDSKLEMDFDAVIDEIKVCQVQTRCCDLQFILQSIQDAVTFNSLLEYLQRSGAEKRRKEKKIEEEDEALIKSIFQRLKEIVRRILDNFSMMRSQAMA